jgi:signal transduction histidine kinase
MADRRRILIVDDSADDRQTYRRYFLQDAADRYEIFEADSGEQALDICRAQELDCILFNGSLPDLDGSAFLGRWRDLRQVKRCAVVMLVGVGNESSVIEALKNGALDYLVKGRFSGSEFQRVVDNAIEKVLLREAIERHKQELARSQVELSQFAYAAAHDLQAPLRRTRAFCELLRKGYRGKLDDQADEYIDYIVNCMEQMQALVSGVLEYGRVGTTGQPLVPTDAEAAADEAMANLELAIQESGASVTRDALPTVTADRLQLVQLFQHVIGNAIKYRAERTPDVHVSAISEGQLVRFSVRDNGIGIDPKHAEAVFTMFKRLHSDEKYPGSGVGLATCKKIVERHGGQIWFDSLPGQGSTFFFTIPRQS